MLRAGENLAGDRLGTRDDDAEITDHIGQVLLPKLAAEGVVDVVDPLLFEEVEGRPVHCTEWDGRDQHAPVAPHSDPFRSAGEADAYSDHEGVEIDDVEGRRPIVGDIERLPVER